MDIEIIRPDEETVYEDVSFANGAWSYSSTGGDGFNIGGEYSVNVAAWDSLGNVAFTTFYTVTLAKPADVFIYPPIISGTLPISPAIGVPLSYSLVVEDDDFSLGDEVQLANIALPEGITATLSANTIVVSGQIEDLSAENPATFFIVVEDLAGNQGTITWQPQGEGDGVGRIYLPIIHKN
jgi:hypothetical protein